MPADGDATKDIFLAAAETADPAGRAAYLDAACGGDAGLRARVDALLRAHARPDPLLDRPAAAHLSAAADTIPLDFLAPPATPGALGRLGHYEVLDVAGRGGMGVVLRAFDEKLRRVVAVKVLAPALAAGPAARRRFVREARAAAAVTHENVIGIHAVEDAGPVPYLVMPFVDGETLQQMIDRAGPRAPREVLRVGLQIAEGLAAAHRHGLVHRDIKPANVLLEDGVGRVKITDFGLARAGDDDAISGPGVVVGTPAYMSPEQAGGGPVDHRSDLFSLGSVLYAMATGRSPFAADSVAAVFHRVLSETPPPLRATNPAAPAALEAVVARLLAKNPADRFQSAAEVAAVLAGQLAELPSGPGSAVAGPKPAPPAPARRPALRWAALGLLLVAAAAGTAWVMTNRPDGRGAAKGDDPPPAEPGLPAEPLQLKHAKRLPGNAGPVFVVAFSPDGKVLAAGGQEPTVRLWNTDTWESRDLPTDHPGDVFGFAFSPDGATLASVASAADQVCVRLSTIATGAKAGTMGGPQSGVCGVAWSPDGATVATGGWDKTLRVWDAATRAAVDSVPDVCPRFIRGLSFSPAGDRIVAGGSGPTRLFDAKTRVPVATHPMPEMCPTYLPAGDGVAGWIHHRPGRVVICDVPSGRVRVAWPAHRGLIEGLAVSPDGRCVATFDPEGTVKVWHVAGTDVTEVATLTGHVDNVFYAAFSPDGARLATAGKGDFTVRVWELPPVCRVRK